MMGKENIILYPPNTWKIRGNKIHKEWEELFFHSTTPLLILNGTPTSVPSSLQSFGDIPFWRMHSHRRNDTKIDTFLAQSMNGKVCAGGTYMQKFLNQMQIGTFFSLLNRGVWTFLNCVIFWSQMNRNTFQKVSVVR